jgi:hypothetical protein
MCCGGCIWSDLKRNGSVANEPYDRSNRLVIKFCPLTLCFLGVGFHLQTTTQIFTEVVSETGASLQDRGFAAVSDLRIANKCRPKELTGR